MITLFAIVQVLLSYGDWGSELTFSLCESKGQLVAYDERLL